MTDPEPVPDPVPDLPARVRSERWLSRWRTVKPFARSALHGAAFAGGALLLARLFGVRVADRLGRTGGESFARGVGEGQRAITRLERGARFG